MTNLRSGISTAEILKAPLGELVGAAFDRARATHGYLVTYSPKVLIPLTKLSRDRCGYCTFAQAPAHVAAPYMSLEEVMAVAQEGLAAGCTEALFTFSERPELRYDEAARWLAARRLPVNDRLRRDRRADGARVHRSFAAHQRRGALPSRTRAASHGVGVPGHDARVAGRPARPPTGPGQGSRS